MAAQASAQAAAAPAWRQFSFFDSVPVKDVHDLASPPDIFKNTLEISTVASSSLGVLVADLHGNVHLLDKDFEPVTSWIGHVGGRITHMVERRNILITLGEEDNVRYPLLKAWDLGRIDQKTSSPALLRSVKVQHGNRPHPVTTIALSSTLSHLAIGLGDGTVLLYRHLDQSLSSSTTSLTALPKPRLILDTSTTTSPEPITGLGFREPSPDDPPTHSHLYLFVVTTNRVLEYQVTGRGSGQAPGTVDEVGCGLGCARMDWRDREIVVARDEAIYLVGIEGRGACFAYEGHKSSIHTHLNYLVIVSPPFTPSASAASATVRNFVARAGTASGDITKVTVFDLENKFVAYSGAINEGVREVFSQWGKIYVLTNDGKLTCLQEKPTSAKLDMLYRKSLYLLALNLAKTQKLDESSVADIHRQYGDHLYGKGDYDGAMAQFVKTIGHLQPSYVIRKFLDAQRIHNLVTYLQELHSLGLANSDHTTLLLNTYTKLKDVQRLDSFIKAESLRPQAQEGELPFDLDTAIRVCRQAGYFEHAGWLARKWGRHEEYLRILIEDAGSHREAVGYLRMLGTEAAESNLAKHGRAMLESLPEETTQLMIDICTTDGPLLAPDTSSEEKEKRVRSPPTRQGSTGPAGYLSYLALPRAPALPTENGAGSERPSRRNSLMLMEGSRGDSPAPAPETTTNRPAKVVRLSKKPSPRVYFSHFVDHLDCFVRFLETVALKRWGQTVDVHTSEWDVVHEQHQQAVVDEAAEKVDQVAVWNTLLELYLAPPTPGGDRRDKALRVLKSVDLPYDKTHALILCSTRGFTPGLVLLWEKMGMYEDVLRFWMAQDKDGSSVEASREVVKHLKVYGENSPQLYPLVLRFLTSDQGLLERHLGDVEGILEVIDERRILSPLGVVKVLSRNGVASVGLVRKWLMKWVGGMRDEIATDQQLINSYRQETKTKLKQVEELSDPEQPRVFHVTRCSSCQAQLDLPSVHFMCNHSYHQRCLGEHETECPNCVRQHGVIREIRRNNERLRDQHDVFLSEVKENGFQAVAAAFGRGVLNSGTGVEGVNA